ncbi:GLIPR1-like protein 1 isoform X2 [Haliotis rubra]|uniref:GLIPR1-like protein 1 isoform X2 n=1 Tax=Haliotis rubra TaxID=36100 RepID=UPI001EE5E592|nr:GLIPR1-like protein 1 isoform X2 [Haliotis rubra]
MRPETVLCIVLALLNVVDSVDVQRLQHYRKKRQQQQPDLEVTALRIQKVLDVHNTLRRMESSTDMNMLTWHSGMAVEAQKMVDDCVWTQRPQSELKSLVQGFSRVSQNIYMSPTFTSIEEVATKWASEKNHYQYQTGLCNKMCWNYKQVVWAKTHSLGCGIRYCPTIQNTRPTQGGYLIACMYGPAGNIGNRRPYAHGDLPCSNCTIDFPYCYDGLCSKVEPPPEPTPTTEKVTIGSSSQTRPFTAGYICVFFMVKFLLRAMV